MKYHVGTYRLNMRLAWMMHVLVLVLMLMCVLVVVVSLIIAALRIIESGRRTHRNILVGTHSTGTVVTVFHERLLCLKITTNHRSQLIVFQCLVELLEIISEHYLQLFSDILNLLDAE